MIVESAKVSPEPYHYACVRKYTDSTAHGVAALDFCCLYVVTLGYQFLSYGAALLLLPLKMGLEGD